MKIVVLGGGATGRLVKMLRPDAVVFEGSPKPRLTRDFGCNYLWAPIPGVESIPGKVYTTIDGHGPTLAAMCDYKRKVGKSHDVDTRNKQEALLEGQFKFEQDCHIVTRFPEPQVQLGYLASTVDPFRKQVTFVGHNDTITQGYDLLVSTIPLNLFIGLCSEFRAFAFECLAKLEHKPIYVKVETVGAGRVDQIYVDYRTEGHVYRTTSYGNAQHSETLEPFTDWRKLSPGKIMPCYGAWRLKDVLKAWDIYTFGRFGSWMPDELLHETYKDIERWTNQSGS